jgi:hypothetical protein
MTTLGPCLSANRSSTPGFDEPALRLARIVQRSELEEDEHVIRIVGASE